MKCRLTVRKKELNPRARGAIRRQLGVCADLTLAEVFGMGNKRICEIREEVQQMYRRFDPLYPDSADYVRALIDLFITDKEIYSERRGSSENVLFGREHDIVFLCYLYQLRKRKYGKVRLVRFQEEICRRIRYYNETFQGEWEDVVPVIEDRLRQRGVISSEVQQ